MQTWDQHGCSSASNAANAPTPAWCVTLMLLDSCIPCRQMLSYADSAVTKNASEKKINSLLDFMAQVCAIRGVGHLCLGRHLQRSTGTHHRHCLEGSQQNSKSWCIMDSWRKLSVLDPKVPAASVSGGSAVKHLSIYLKLGCL